MLKLISIFADAIKSQLLLKLVTSSIVICCQGLYMVKVLYRKLSYCICKLRYYSAGPPNLGEDTNSHIKIKSTLFLIRNLLFNERNATEKCESSGVYAPDHGVGSDKKASKSY